jgi:DNA-binding MarR family transcriptional regulator
MNLRDELRITKPLEPGQEILLSLLLSREHASRLSDVRLFKPAGITDQQFNVLRILKGGPKEGYLIRQIRHRMISRSADVPRLVDRMVRADLVLRCEDPSDRRGCLVRLTPAGEELEARLAPIHTELCREVGGILEPWETKALLGLLQQLRDGMQKRLETGTAPSIS